MKPTKLQVAMKQLFSMKRRLKYKAQEMGLKYECKVEITDYSSTETKVEDNGKTYKYPESYEIRIESRSTHHYSMKANGRWIECGRNLSGKGQSTAQVYKTILLELREHADEIFKRNLDSITVADIATYRASKAVRS